MSQELLDGSLIIAGLQSQAVMDGRGDEMCGEAAGRIPALRG